MARLVETAFAKVNLDLRIVERRADGYHDLDSIVVFADIGDHLFFKPADGFHLTIEGPFGDALAEGCDNLVTRAARALAEMAGCRVDVHVTLEKRLPIASGLGGGSADAAATLRGLKRLWHLPHSLADLVPLARALGADVPVCLGSSTAQMQDIGDRLTPMSPPDGLSMVLINPGQAVATADVFRAVEIFSGARDGMPRAGGKIDFLDHLIQSVNDLEISALGIAPEIGTVLDTLRAQPGCLLARMSGSGATCFGLFDDTKACRRAVETVEQSKPGWWVVSAALR